jgi:hypothetical protein
MISTISTDVSVEQVALLAQQNTLPEPTLDLSLLSYIPAPPSGLSAAYTNNQRPGTTQNSTSNGSAAVATAAVRSTTTSAPAAVVVVAPPPDDPWMTFGAGAGGVNGGGGGVAPPSSVAGSGLPSGWWKRQEKVAVQFSGQQGFVLNRYMVYGISTEVRRRPVELSLIISDFPTFFWSVDISVVAGCSGGTPSSRSCGTVWFADILSVYCRSYLPNELGVRDWNCLSEVLAGSLSTFSF